MSHKASDHRNNNMLFSTAFVHLPHGADFFTPFTSNKSSLPRSSSDHHFSLVRHRPTHRPSSHSRRSFPQFFLLALYSSSETTTTDNSTRTSTSISTPKRIAIIGAGPAGLSTALALRKYLPSDTQVAVFERKPRSQLCDYAAGGAFNIYGACAALADLGLDQQLRQIGNPFDTIHAYETSSGKKLYQVQVAQAFQRAGLNALFHESENGEKMPWALTVLRADLQNLLLEALDPCVQVSYSKTVKDIIDTQNQEAPVQILFDDNSQQGFDLVIGADGIRSVVRQHLCPRLVEPKYTHIKLSIAVTAGERSTLRPKGTIHQLHQYFSTGCYSLVYSAPGKHPDSYVDMIVVCVRDSKETPENASYFQEPNLLVARDHLLQVVRAAQLPAHVEDIAHSASRIFTIGVYDHAVLPTWFRGRVVVLGDSAHAMAPFLGQGCNQAVQDAVFLAKCLANEPSLQAALQQFESHRKPPTSALIRKSGLLGYIETAQGPGTLARNALFKVAGWLGITTKVFVDGAKPRYNVSSLVFSPQVPRFARKLRALDLDSCAEIS